MLADSAFIANNNAINGKIVRARKVGETQGLAESEVLSRLDITLQGVMPSERQSAEWGIRAIKGTFDRLRPPLSADAYVRRRLLAVCAHLKNLRTRCVGLNQIRTVYANDDEETQPWLSRFLSKQDN